MFEITHMLAREVIDSRGNPTVEAQVTLSDGSVGSAIVPSGASTGSQEALELRDGDAKRYFGKGVLKAVDHINSVIAPKFSHKKYDQKNLDEQLCEGDGTANKSHYGANAILGVSLAFARAVAAAQKLPLYQSIARMSDTSTLTIPVPMMNIINGGAHADNNIDIQEFMILPVGAPTFKEALRYGIEIYHTLKGQLKKKSLNTNVGDEGGFAPNLASNEAAIEFILAAIEQTGLKVGQDVCLGLDLASSEFYKDGKYQLAAEGKSFTTEAFVDYLCGLARQYPIITMEDAMAEQDWAGWSALTQKLGEKIQLVGDDVFVTNTRLIQTGIEQKAANAVLIKVNQIGTLTETLQAIALARTAGWNVIISHRSGETEDTFIADLSVGVNAMQIKTGAPCRSDRVAKYNQLLRIEEALGKNAKYAGKGAFSGKV